MSALRALVLGVGLLASGCGDDGGPANSADSGVDCEVDTRDETYVAGMEKMGASDVRFVLRDALPSPPDTGNNTWTVELFDASDAPIEDVENIDVYAFMPDHGHDSKFPPEETSSTGEIGVYEVGPINFFMPGYWEVTLTAQNAAGDIDSVMYKFCVED